VLRDAIVPHSKVAFAPMANLKFRRTQTIEQIVQHCIAFLAIDTE
jgi:hypothetical protein